MVRRRKASLANPVPCWPGAQGMRCERHPAVVKKGRGSALVAPRLLPPERTGAGAHHGGCGLRLGETLNTNSLDVRLKTAAGARNRGPQQAQATATGQHPDGAHKPSLPPAIRRSACGLWERSR